MLDLSAVAGLPLTLDDENPDLPVRLPAGLEPGRLDQRRRWQLRRSLDDGQADGPDPAYWMYRDVARFRAREGATEYEWRYDITVLPPGRYGNEYLRTAGHYHPVIEDRGFPCPEVYEVLHGRALFILQRVDDYLAGPEDVRVMDVILLEATAGQKAMMLPEYGHWTVNVTEEPLVIANWIDPRFSSYYASVEAARGPGCYVRPGADGLRLTRNGRYTQVPELLRRARTVDVPELGLLARRPLSTELPRDPARWRYLCDPAKAAVELMDAIEIVSTEPFPESSV